MRRLPLPLLRAARAGVVAAGLATAVTAIAPAPAWAHTRLVSSTPSAGASAAAPVEVVLVFNDPVQPALSALSVTGAGGEEHVAGAPSPRGDGSSVSQALEAPLDDGTYRVAYRVLAADGHPITGSFEFTSTAPAGAPSSATTPAPTTGPVETAAGSSDDGEEDGGGLPVLPLVVGGLVVAGVGGLLARRLGGAPRGA